MVSEVLSRLHVAFILQRHHTHRCLTFLVLAVIDFAEAENSLLLLNSLGRLLADQLS